MFTITFIWKETQMCNSKCVSVCECVCVGAGGDDKQLPY